MPGAKTVYSFPGWKRAMDVVGSVVGLILLAIPMAIIGIAIWFESGGPILIAQRRIGSRGCEYKMWKFRTLPPKTPQLSKADLIAAGIRARPLGKFLRRYSLDELPQVLNVLMGDMSLVGPRPALFTQDDLVRLRRDAGIGDVRPGLTGLAQISGREDLTLEQKVALDVDYVKQLSPLSDLAILARTTVAILRARGSY